MTIQGDKPVFVIVPTGQSLPFLPAPEPANDVMASDQDAPTRNCPRSWAESGKRNKTRAFPGFSWIWLECFQADL